MKDMFVIHEYVLVLVFILLVESFQTTLFDHGSIVSCSLSLTETKKT